jgi:cell division protein FtsA
MSEFAEEILGMPVRIGYPVGIKGITQLVQGPQFATGVGLVKFGAQALAHAREVGRPEKRVLSQRQTAEAMAQLEAPPKKAKFLQWLKAAF